MDLRAEEKMRSGCMLAAAACALVLSGCGSGASTGPERRELNVESSDATPLAKRELQSILPFSEFTAHVKDGRTILVSLRFGGDNEVIYTTVGEAILSDAKYFEINSSNICVYQDKNLQNLYECIEFFEWKEDVFLLRFTNSGGLSVEVLYDRISNH